jgi:hypothetical protein
MAGIHLEKISENASRNSLFGSWVAQELNPFQQCLAALFQPNPSGYL